MSPPDGHTAERRKELGAFYTPRAIADVLTRWCVRTASDTVVDPSFGGCVFLESARDRLIALGAVERDALARISGIDADPVAVGQATSMARLDGVRLIASDFFDVEPRDINPFDANIGNPPYVRYQNWDAAGSRAHAIAREQGVPLTKLASMWAPFIIHGCRFLKPGGRMGQVLPAEILHAQYARPVIEYLTAHFASVTLALFTERVFPGALEEVVLLFAEGYGDGPAAGIGIMHAAHLDDLDISAIDGTGEGYLDPSVGLLTCVPRDAARIYSTLCARDDVRPLGELAVVNIGVVTGANSFFLRTDEDIAAHGYDRSLFRPVVGKAQDIPGAHLTTDDMTALASRGRPTHLLVARGDDDESALATITPLIHEGEQADLHRRYKCRARDPWWSVPLPTIGTPDAFLTYMSDGYPRLVANEAGALSTNTIHNIVLSDDVDVHALAVAFYNSLTLLSAELVGRSYGGGLLKLEPTEASRVLIPPFRSDLKTRLAETDRLLREGDIDAVITANDEVLLTPLGLDGDSIRALRSARSSLRERRRARGRAASPRHGE